MCSCSTPCKRAPNPHGWCSELCLLRVMLGCCLLLPAGVAGASQLPSFVPSLPAAAGTRGGMLPATADNDSDALVPSHRRNPLLVAEQDGGRRQDMNAVAVLYPDIGEPYRSIFGEILDGIQGMATAPVASYAIGPASDVTDLNGQLKRNGTKVVIALGRQGLKAATALDAGLSIVAGGVISAPDSNRHSLTGISLTPDPGLLFARLKSLMPEARRVIVIYDPQNNEWLLELAREAARAQGLELVAHQARDLASAARLYQSAFAAADSRHDAIWLPQDATTVDENTILPLVLREAWNRGVPVFSSSLLHVRKGVLFALYPDNVELGRALGHDAEAVLGGDSHRGMLPLRAVLTAVNLRTASHMGLNIGYQQQRSFDMIFPEP